MERIICLAIGYVCGLLQSGYLVGKYGATPDIEIEEVE